MWSELSERILAWIGDGRTGRTAGFLVGIGLGIIYLFWGFWDMLAFGLIVLAGYTLGLKSDNREKWMDIGAVARRLTQRWYR